MVRGPLCPLRAYSTHVPQILDGGGVDAVP
jgi:hypothetical protein